MQQNNASDTTEPKFNTVWLPLLVGVLIFASISLLAWVLNQQQKVAQFTTLQSENSKVATYIDADIHSRILTLQRLANHWGIHNGLTKLEFSAEVQSIINDLPGFQAIEWVDDSYHVRWIVPLVGNEAAQDLNLAAEEKRRIALETAKDYGAPTMTLPVDLVQGGKGFLVYIPIHSNGQFNGFILAVFRIDPWLNYVLAAQEPQDVEDKLRTSLSMDEIPVFKQTGWDASQSSNMEASTTINILDHRFTVRSQPTAVLTIGSNSYLPQLVIIAGLLVALLIASMVRLSQRAISEVWRTYAAKSALESEIQEHQKTAGELQYTLSRLDMATKAGGIGVWSWHVPTNFLTWNERMYSLFDIPPDVMPMYATWRNAIHPDDLLATETHLNNAVLGKAIFNTEFRIILSNGSVRYLGAAASVERDFTGRPNRVNGINWDLTELKEAELTLKKSEEQVRLLLNSTAEAIYGIDMDGNCTFANPSCLRLLGYTDVGQLLGTNMHWRIHHSYPDGTRMPVEDCYIFKALRAGIDVHRDDEVLWRADRTSFPAEYWSYPQIAAGKVTGAVVTFIDITERKLAGDLLITERRRLAAILEGTFAGTWEWNVQTGETVFNERWANILGYTLADLAPVSIETWTKFVHPDDLILSNELIQKHFNGELDYYECETRMRHRDGVWVWVLDRGKLTARTSDGKPLLMSGTHQDVTERKVMETVLRQSEAQNRALLSAVPDLIFRIQRDGNILDYKASSTELLLVPAEKMIGYSLFSILDEPSSVEARACIDKAIQSGQVQSMEFNLKLGESTHIFEARFKSSGIDEVLTIIRDISERSRLEQMKSDFINRATHELRTPIATMLLMVNLLDDHLIGSENEEYWGVLKGELNRERRLVEDLLSAGRLESDRFQFDFRSVEILELITRVIDEFKIAAHERNITLTFESLLLQMDTPALVRADESALTQVFINLVSNAIKFTLVGGKVHVRVQESDSGILVSISDTGMGIPSEDIPMLFNRFFRGTNAVEQEVQGTGIGLFIVRSILDKHGGKVQVASELGMGSKFEVWLPEVKE